MKLFRDRKEAGRLLAQELEQYRNREGVVVVAVRETGNEVAREIAERLGVETALGKSAITVILVDDGALTGATMRDAIRQLKQRSRARVVAALPVGSSDACEILSREADEVICLAISEPFTSVSESYVDFKPDHDSQMAA
jgi:putative phosphoribosyl transferase